VQNFAFKFQAVAEKTAKNIRGLLYFAAPCIYRRLNGGHFLRHGAVEGCVCVLCLIADSQSVIFYCQCHSVNDEQLYCVMGRSRNNINQSQRRAQGSTRQRMVKNRSFSAVNFKSLLIQLGAVSRSARHARAKTILPRCWLACDVCVRACNRLAAIGQCTTLRPQSKTQTTAGERFRLDTINFYQTEFRTRRDRVKRNPDPPPN